MIDKIYHTSHGKLIAVAIAAYELLSKLCKLPRGGKFEMSHPDFDGLGAALMEIADSPAPPPPVFYPDISDQLKLAVSIFITEWQGQRRDGQDIYQVSANVDGLDVRVAVAVHAIPEDVRRRMVAPFN